MSSIVRFIARIVGAMCTVSIAGGILLWLDGKGIYPDRWVNTVIGLAEETVTASPAGTWILLGLAGMLGLAIGPSIYDWGIANFGRKHKTEVPVVSQSSEPHQEPSDSWRHVSEYKLWQVACLWVGCEPEARIPDGHPAYPILQMLKADVTNYKLLAAEDIAGQRIVIHAEGERKSNVDMNTLINRPMLLDYISNHKDKPEWDFGSNDSEPKPKRQSNGDFAEWEPLQSAAYWAIYKSKWGKWQREQYSDSAYNEEYFLRDRMGMVAHLVTGAAIDGKISLKGRPPNAIEFESISPAIWQLVALSVKPDNALIYKLEIIRRGVVTGDDPEKGLGKRKDIRTKGIRNTLRYDALLVNFEQFRSFFEQMGPNDG